jgi:hypothetical protein
LKNNKIYVNLTFVFIPDIKTNLEPSEKTVKVHFITRILTSRNTVFETPGEKPGGSRAASTTRDALEPPGFSPGVSKTVLREVKMRVMKWTYS